VATLQCIVTPAAILSGQAGGASTGKEDNFLVIKLIVAEWQTRIIKFLLPIVAVEQ
jgi:hypothetical protein